jgi:hypothetical protein
MAEKYPLINGCLRSFPNGEPMVITARVEQLHTEPLLVWRAAIEWCAKRGGVKALYLHLTTVGVDLYVHEDEDPDALRHLAEADLDVFIADYIPPHAGCEAGNCDACFAEMVRAERANRAGR